MIKKVFLSLALVAAAATASAQDWPQFLGPTADSKSPQTNLLREWPAAGPEVKWTTNVGIGYGGPVVRDGKVYILDRDAEKETETMRCIDLQTGKDLWGYTYPSTGAVMFPGSRSVPTLDGNYVYSCGHNGDLYCIDITTGKPVWNKNIFSGYGGTKLPTWAISQIPLVYGDLVYVVAQTPTVGMVALNKKTGAEVWKTAPYAEITYASPSVVKVSGEDHISIVISSVNGVQNPNAPKQMGRVIGYDPKTGKELWSYDNWDCHISCAPVTAAGDNKFLVVGGYERGASMFQVIKGADGKYSTKELFVTVEFGDQTKPALLHNGLFYAMYGTNSRRDGLCCMDMNGNVLWKTKRAPNFDKGSMILADGLIIATDGASSLYLIEPSAEGYKQISAAPLLAGGDGTAELGGRMANGNWAPLALADGLLLIRNHQVMKCVKVTK